MPIFKAIKLSIWYSNSRRKPLRSFLLDNSIPSAPAHGTRSSLAEQTLPRGFPAHKQRQCCFPPSSAGPRIIKNGTNELWGKSFCLGLLLQMTFGICSIRLQRHTTWKNGERRDNLQDLSWKLKCVLKGSCWICTSPKSLFPATPQGCS